MLNLKFDEGVFFSLWLPMHKNDFFESIGFHRNPLDEGVVIKVVKYFFSNPDFSLEKNGDLFLPGEHSFFYKNEKDYFAENSSLSDHLKDYVHEDILKNCELLIGNSEIKNSSDPDGKLVKITDSMRGSNQKVKIPFLKLYLIHKESNVRLTFTVDAYGFYFFDFSKNKNQTDGQKLANIIAMIFGGEHICHSLNKTHNYANNDIVKALKENHLYCHYKGILTHDQLLFLQEGLANYNLNYKLFFEIITPGDNLTEFLEIIKEYQIGKLIKRILVPYLKQGLKNKILESIKSSRFYEMNIEDSVAVRTYNFRYVSDLIEYHKGLYDNVREVAGKQAKVVTKRVEEYSFEHIERITKATQFEDKQIKMILSVITQDFIEEKALTRFIEVTLANPYLSEIESGVYVARKRLTNTMLEMTPGNAIDQISFDTDKMAYLFTEENLGNYIKLIVSKIPLLKTIDSIMRDAYYIKIGNLSVITHTSDKEQIDRLASYRSWSASIKTIISNKGTLLDNLSSYYEMKTDSTLDETRRIIMSSNDKDDIKYAWDHENSDKSFVISLFAAVAFLYYFRSLLNGGHSGSGSESPHDIWNVLLSFIGWGAASIAIYIISNRFLSSAIHKKMKNFFLGSYENKKSIEYRVSEKSLNKAKATEQSDNLAESIDFAMKVSESLEESLFHDTEMQHRIANSSVSILNNKMQRLHIQIEIPSFTHSSVDGFFHEYSANRLQVFIVVTLIIKRTKIDQLDIFLDSAKVHYRVYNYPGCSIKGIRRALSASPQKSQESSIEKSICAWFIGGIALFEEKEIV